MAVPAVRVNDAPAFVAIELGAGTIRMAVEATIGPARGPGPGVGAVALQAIERTATTGDSANWVLIIDFMTQSAAQKARVQAAVRRAYSASEYRCTEPINASLSTVR